MQPIVEADSEKIPLASEKGFDRNGKQKWTVSKLDNDVVSRLSKIDSEISLSVIEEVVAHYQKIEHDDRYKEKRNMYYEIIDSWSMCWRDYWHSKFADTCALSEDEFNSEYRMAVLDAVRDFDITWSKPNHKGVIRKSHFNGLLYLKLYQRFVDFISFRNRVSKKKSFRCPQCNEWVTTITNKHCMEYHKDNLADFNEKYPNYNNYSRELSLDDEHFDEGAIKDNIDSKDINEDMADFIESIKHLVSQEETELLQNIFIHGTYNIEYQHRIINALRENKKLHQHLIRMTIGE